MTITLLQSITDTTKMMTKVKTSAPAPGNYWMWVAAAELLLIGYLVYKLSKKKLEAPNPESPQAILRAAKNAPVDMDELMKNINNSRHLYKQLSAKCHPDRFAADEEKRKIADDLFQEITRHKRNYSKLIALQEQARQQLSITL